MNEAEERFRKLMVERGATVLRAGWRVGSNGVGVRIKAAIGAFLRPEDRHHRGFRDSDSSWGADSSSVPATGKAIPK